MHFEGILIGVSTFLIIGLFHPIVIKTEYYFTKNVWPVFVVVGIIFMLLSVFNENTTISIILAVFGSCSFWSVKELYEQEERVAKGWFPANPNRKNKTKKERVINYEMGRIKF